MKNERRNSEMMNYRAGHTEKSAIYEFEDYKTFLRFLLDSGEDSGRGKRKLLAEFIRCQVSHVSNVLSGSGHFTAEQAESAARFFGLDRNETEFFLTLIQSNRAATESLRKVYARMLQGKKAEMTSLKRRLLMPDSISAAQEARYYSSWQYGAIHVVLSVPGVNTREAVSSRLAIPLRRVDEILFFLSEIGVCRKNGQQFELLRTQLHLSKESPLISKHHANWRMRAMQALDDSRTEGLHYSSVFTFAKKDESKVRAIFTRALEEAMGVITESKEETVGVLGIDLFRIEARTES